MDNNRLFRRIPIPAWINNSSVRTAGVYLSGAVVSCLCHSGCLFRLGKLTSRPQFSLGFFLFLDAAVFSHSSLNGSTIHVTFVDWIPLICSVLGMTVINSIEKSRLSAD